MNKRHTVQVSIFIHRPVQSSGSRGQEGRTERKERARRERKENEDPRTCSRGKGAGAPSPSPDLNHVVILAFLPNASVESVMSLFKSL